MIDDFTAEELESLFFVFKLLNGDTIMCQVLQDTDKTVIVRDPFQVNVHTVESANGMRAMTYYSEWFSGVDNRIHMIRKDHILSAAVPNQELKTEYTRLILKKTARETAKVQPKKDWTGLNYKFDKKSRFDLN